MNPFLSEAITEGRVLRDLADGYAAADGLAIKAAGGMFRRAGCRRLAFAGTGSSYSAPWAVIDHLATHGIPAIAPTAQRLAANRTALVTADTLVVAISKSGTTKEILDLVDGIGLQAGLIALVNQPDSVLAGRCQVVLPMRAGIETQIASKSFLCTLAVLNLLAAELTGMPGTELLNQLRELSEWADAHLSATSDTLASGATALMGSTHVDVVASGPSFITAYKSALVLREVPRIAATAVDCADYAHGWAKIAGPNYTGIVLAPAYHEPSMEARAVGQILDRGGRAVLITESPVPPREGLTVLNHPILPERLAPLAQAVICDALIGAMADVTQSRADN
jgi:fructoselysine-6-P-deglycase FrlB-like protein